MGRRPERQTAHLGALQAADAAARLRPRAYLSGGRPSELRFDQTNAMAHPVEPVPGRTACLASPQVNIPTPDPNLSTRDVLAALHASGKPLHEWGRAIDGTPLLA